MKGDFVWKTIKRQSHKKNSVSVYPENRHLIHRLVGLGSLTQAGKTQLVHPLNKPDILRHNLVS